MLSNTFKKCFIYIFITFNILNLSFSSINKDNFQDYLKNNKVNINRIVSLSPSATEIIFAVGSGDKLVARTDFCNYPNDVLDIPSVGGFDAKSFSLESILMFKPDFVYLTEGMHNHLISTLEKLGILVFVSDCSTISDVLLEITAIGQLTSSKEKTLECVAKIQSELNQIKKITSNKTIYVEICANPFISVGKLSYINDLISFTGCTNIFSDIYQSYPQVNEEFILSSNPDIIIVPDYTDEQVKQIYQRHGWKNIKALQENKVFSVDGDVFSRPGPRLVEAIKIIEEIISK